MGGTMIYRYLTAEYVDWLKLNEVPFIDVQPYAGCVNEHAPYYSHAYPTGVVLDGLRYVRSRCGRSFDLCAADLFGLEHAKPISVGDAFDENTKLGV